MSDRLSLQSLLDPRIPRFLNGGVCQQHPIDSTFFKMRGFKKGTLHIDFKDLDLLAKFNQAAAKGKKWLGDGS